jgi:hypothetical protein
MSSQTCREEDDDSLMRGGSGRSQEEDRLNIGSSDDDSSPEGHISGLKESLLDSDSLATAQEDFLINPPLSASLTAAEGDTEKAEVSPDNALRPSSSMDMDDGALEDDDDELFGSNVGSEVSRR